MKKFFTLILFIALINASGANSLPKLSPLTQKLLRQKSKMEQSGYLNNFVHRNIHNQVFLSGLIKVNALINEGALSSLGVTTGTKAGNIWTVMVPLQSIEAFTKLTGVDYIQLD